MESTQHIVVIGAGIAGMETALNLSALGHRVTLVEKEKKPGGHLNNWHQLFPDFAGADSLVSDLHSRLNKKEIKTITGTEITAIKKNKANITITAGEEMSLKADAVVIASGFKLFDSTRKEEYGYGLYENVITSADLEKRFNEGTAQFTPSGKTPRRIAIIHCVGSRDAKAGNTYCSKVCCITGIKQAIELNKLLPESEIFCFYMDLRLYGSKFDDLYLEAQKQHKIQFIRGRLSESAEKADKSLQIKAEDTLNGRPLRMDVDMIVLLAGMEPAEINENFGCDSELHSDSNGFLKSENMHVSRNKSTMPGVFIAGTCVCPMSVNETLENARSAAIEVNSYLKRKKS